MQRFALPAVLVLAAAALVVALLQRAEITDLEGRLSLAEKALVAATEALEAAEPAAPAPEAPAIVDRGAEIAALAKRVGALERKAGERVAMRDAVRRPWASKSGEPPAEEVKDEVSSLREDVDSLLEGDGLDSPEARQRVRKMVDEVRREARQERMQRFQKMREEADREWVTEMTDKAGLSEDQAAGLSQLLTDQRAERQRLWQAVRDGDKTMSEARQERRATRQATDTRLGEILTGEQLETVRQSLRDRRGGGPRGMWR